MGSSYSTTGDGPEHRPQLDGLRAFAVIAVLVHHSVGWVHDHLSPGSFGVHLFFVLSGFLITAILLRARRDAEGRGGPVGVLFAFYARRFLRIFPVYYASLAVLLVLGVPALRETAWWHLGYLSNIFFARRGEWLPGIAHLWSLSVEEQFYLFWPALMLFLPRRWLLGLILAAISLGPVSRCAAFHLTGNAISAGVLTTACLDLLGTGALLAWLSTAGAAEQVRRLGRMGLLFGLPLYLLVQLLRNRVGHTGAVVVFDGIADALLGVWLVEGAARGFGGKWGVVLRSGPLVYLGRISYGIYLFHLFVPLVAHRLETTFDIWLRFPDTGWLNFIAITLLAVPAAACSWHFFEGPVNGLKCHFPYVRGSRAARDTGPTESKAPSRALLTAPAPEPAGHGDSPSDRQLIA